MRERQRCSSRSTRSWIPTSRRYCHRSNNAVRLCRVGPPARGRPGPTPRAGNRRSRENRIAGRRSDPGWTGPAAAIAPRPASLSPKKRGVTSARMLPSAALSHRRITLSLLPIAVGHAAAIALVLLAVLALGLVLDHSVAGRVAAAPLIGWALWHAVRGHRQQLRVGQDPGQAAEKQASHRALQPLSGRSRNSLVRTDSIAQWEELEPPVLLSCVPSREVIEPSHGRINQNKKSTPFE